MTRKRVFLDTSVLVARVTKRSQAAIRIFKDSLIEKFTNKWALKELYYVLKDEFKFSELEISYAMDYIRATCVILPTPSKNEFKKIDIRDKSDRPFVCSAMKYDLILLIDDEKTFIDAGKYVNVERVPKD